MRIRLFFLVTAFLIVAGLLLPVGVHAVDSPTPDGHSSIATENVNGEPCANHGDSSNTSSAAVEEDTSVDAAEGDTTTDASNQCSDPDGSYLRVSWNS